MRGLAEAAKLRLTVSLQVFEADRSWRTGEELASEDQGCTIRCGRLETWQQGLFQIRCMTRTAVVAAAPATPSTAFDRFLSEPVV
mmetsp:Transcript_117091/g.227664  ORF Transcript_117091/g.227664 Transcript_117091/m.227664 type:complete len:85 (+) Transcript_117091:2849-3103(+)